MGAFSRQRVEQVLSAAGFDAADLPGRLALVDQCAREFEHRHGRAAAWAWWVPGRIEVFGKHTDYAGGRSLVAAVPRGFAVAAGPRDDETVTAADVRWSASTEIRLNDPDRRYHGWANYVAVVVRRLARNFPGAPLGADLCFASDLPRAAGLSSSSALVVGVSLALIKRGSLDQRPEWHAAIHDRLDLGGYLGAVENGLNVPGLPGTSGVGTFGGSEDHTAILNSEPGAVGAFSYVPTRREGRAAMPADWRFVIATSGVEAAKAGAAQARYNRASLGTRALVEVWRQESGIADGQAPTLARILQEPEAGRRLRGAIDRHRQMGFSPEDLSRRLTHFIAEDGRVRPALDAFGTADRDGLGRLSAASQADAERLLGNQIPETSALAALAFDCGAFAASSFGAGFGGSVWALVNEAAAGELCARWLAEYRTRFPRHQGATGQVIRPGPAALEI
ncbi:MAG TPA: galactokinase family protein [Vicinamibacterales bacterium]|nr:galactokinase family protein [Vicinamibacterales bacterium]